MTKSMVIVIALAALLFAQPVAAEPLGVGVFSGASNHKTSGSVTVTNQGGQYVIELGGDFSFDGAPDPYVALGKQKKPLEGGVIAVLKSDKGGRGTWRRGSSQPRGIADRGACRRSFGAHRPAGAVRRRRRRHRGDYDPGGRSYRRA